MTAYRRARGFTLIELMIVVAIIAIVAGIGYPSYKNYVLKAHRASAQAFLMDAAQRQQQYFLDNRAFAPDIATLFGVATNAAAIPAEVSTYYADPVVTSALTPPTFTIKIAPKGSQAVNNEPELSIDNTGTKQPPDKW